VPPGLSERRIHTPPPPVPSWQPRRAPHLKFFLPIDEPLLTRLDDCGFLFPFPTSSFSPSLFPLVFFKLSFLRSASACNLPVLVSGQLGFFFGASLFAFMAGPFSPWLGDLNYFLSTLCLDSTQILHLRKKRLEKRSSDFDLEFLGFFPSMPCPHDTWRGMCWCSRMFCSVRSRFFIWCCWLGPFLFALFSLQNLWSLFFLVALIPIVLFYKPAQAGPFFFHVVWSGLLQRLPGPPLPLLAVCVGLTHCFLGSPLLVFGFFRALMFFSRVPHLPFFVVFSLLNQTPPAGSACFVL